MTLCLYGSAARLGRGSVKPLISPAADEMLLRLEFELGDQTYRASRRIRHAGQTRARLERVTSEGDETLADGPSDVNRRVRALLRLDYEAFCRTVLLPQGEFEEFLVGDRHKRREIMNELLRLERYGSVAELARRRQGNAKNRLQNAEALVGEYADATPDARRAAEELVRKQEARASALEKMEREARERVAGADAARGRADALAHMGADLLGHADAAQQLAARHERLRPDHERTERELRDAGKSTAAARAGRERAEAERDRVEREVGDTLAHQDIERAMREASTAEDDIERLTPQHAEAEGTLSKRRTALEEAGRIESEASRQHLDARTASEAAAGAARDASRGREQAKARDDAQRALSGLADQIEATGASLDDAERALAAAEANLAAIGERMRELEHRDHALAVRFTLAEGSGCPVCEQTVTTVPPMPDGLFEARVELEARQEAAEASEVVRRHERDEVQGRLERLDGRREEKRAQLDRLGDAPDLPAAAVAVRDAKRTVKEASGREERAVHRLAGARGAREQADGDVQSAGHELSKLADQIADAKRRAKGAGRVLLAHLGDPLPDDAETALEQRRTLLAAAEQAASSATAAERDAADAERAAREAHDANQAKHTALAGDLRGLVAALRTLYPLVCEQLAGDGLTPPAEPDCPDVPWRLGNDFVAALRDRASVAREAATTFADRAEADLDEVARMRGEVGIEAPKGRTESEQIADALDDAREQRARARADQDQLRRRLQAREAHEVQRVEAEAEHAAWRALAEPLQGSGFIDFVIAEVLDGLCDIASARLREISGDRYSLQAEELNFRVIDHFNADQVRDASTLSGGERFLASLALALALAESVRTAGGGLPAELDAVFIDEGFSSLDAESLDVTLSALETLAQRELMVGVISHVDSVPERISDGFEVVVEHNRSRVRAR